MRKPQHQLEVLHRLPCGALAEVVEHGADNGLLSRLVGEDMNSQLIGACERLGVEVFEQRQSLLRARR